MRTVSLPTAALAALGLAGVAAAQQKVEMPVFGTQVEIVAVPVFVADTDGKAVPGLTQADFEVEDEGKKVPIVGFMAVDAGEAALPSGPGPSINAAARRQFVFLFDFTFSTPMGVSKAREAALQVVQKDLAPNDLVAVAVLNPTGPQIPLRFTTDHAQAARAIAELGTAADTVGRLRDPLNIAYDLGINIVEETQGIDVTGEKVSRTGESRMAEHLREQLLAIGRGEQRIYSQAVGTYLGNMGGLAELFNSVQGRKQVVLFSAGFDQSVLGGATGEAAYTSRENVARGNLWEVQSESHFGDTSTSSALQGLFRVLRGNDMVLHTVDVAGIGTDVDAANFGRIASGKGKDTLAQLASGTGGRFVQQTNDLAKAMREILDATRYYYVLAFEPSESKKKPGEVRRLKVKVNRPGSDISHRTAYVLPDPKAAATGPAADLRAAEAITKGITGGAVRLSAVAVPYRSAKGTVSLPVVLEVDGESLLQGADAKKPLSLEIFGYALDGEGRVLDAFAVTPTLNLAEMGERVRSKGVQVLTAFRAKEGTADLRFLVRSPTTGRAGALRTSVDVPSFAKDQLFVSSPLVIDDPRGRVVLPTPSRANPQLEIPFRLADMPFTPEGLPRLRNGEAREVCLMTWKGPSYATDSKLEVAAELVGGGEPVKLATAAPRVVNDNDGFQRLVLGLTPSGVKAGDYVLRVSVKDPQGGETTSALTVRVQ